MFYNPGTTGEGGWGQGQEKGLVSPGGGVREERGWRGGGSEH